MTFKEILTLIIQHEEIAEIGNEMANNKTSEDIFVALLRVKSKSMFNLEIELERYLGDNKKELQQKFFIANLT